MASTRIDVVAASPEAKARVAEAIKAINDSMVKALNIRRTLCMCEFRDQVRSAAEAFCARGEQLLSEFNDAFSKLMVPSPAVDYDKPMHETIAGELEQDDPSIVTHSSADTPWCSMLDRLVREAKLPPDNSSPGVTGDESGV